MPLFAVSRLMSNFSQAKKVLQFFKTPSYLEVIKDEPGPNEYDPKTVITRSSMPVYHFEKATKPSFVKKTTTKAQIGPGCYEVKKEVALLYRKPNMSPLRKRISSQ